MSRADLILAEGTVTATPGGGFYDVALDNGAVIRCTLGGKLRRHAIRVLPQDRVRVAITPYQLDRGFITFRHLG